MSSQSLSRRFEDDKGEDDPYAGVTDHQHGELTDERVLTFLDRLWHTKDELRQGAAETFVEEWELPITAETILATMDQIYGGA